MNLDRSGDYETYIVNKSTQAFAAVKKIKPDIIFLDVMMPELDGGGVAALLREDPELSPIPIVFLTAIVSKEEITQMGSQVGGNEYLAKPIKIQEMIDTIERMLGK
ncbi:MAG: response regulator [Desulfobacula sp.]|nr:response regulator [Desulfobacula sp.]